MISLDLSLLFLRNFSRCVTSGPDPKGGHSTHIHRSSRARAGPYRGRICSGFDLPFASPLNRRCSSMENPCLSERSTGFLVSSSCSLVGAPSISPLEPLHHQHHPHLRSNHRIINAVRISAQTTASSTPSASPLEPPQHQHRPL